MFALPKKKILLTLLLMPSIFIINHIFSSRNKNVSLDILLLIKIVLALYQNYLYSKLLEGSLPCLLHFCNLAQDKL